MKQDFGALITSLLCSMTSAEICTASGCLSGCWWHHPVATRQHRCRMLYEKKSNFPVTWGWWWGRVAHKWGNRLRFWNNSCVVEYLSNAGWVEVIRVGGNPSESLCADQQDLTASYFCWMPPKMKPLTSLPKTEIINNCYNCLSFIITSKRIFFFTEILIKFYINSKCAESFYQQKSLLGISALFQLWRPGSSPFSETYTPWGCYSFDSPTEYHENSFTFQDLKSLIRFVFLKANVTPWEIWRDILFRH